VSRKVVHKQVKTFDDFQKMDKAKVIELLVSNEQVERLLFQAMKGDKNTII